MKPKPSIGIFVFNGVELLDVAGPLEVFAVADELSHGEFGAPFTFAQSGEPVRSVAGLRLIPDCPLASVQAVDLLVIPGGEGVRHWMDDSAILGELDRLAQTSSIRMTVCSGALAAAKLGWIHSSDFCTHHEVADEVMELAPQAHWRHDLRFIEDNGYYSSAGISAGIDLALHLVAQLHSQELAHEVARYMEYTPQ